MQSCRSSAGCSGSRTVVIKLAGLGMVVLCSGSARQVRMFPRVSGRASCFSRFHNLGHGVFFSEEHGLALHRSFLGIPGWQDCVDQSLRLLLVHRFLDLRVFVSSFQRDQFMVLERSCCQCSAQDSSAGFVHALISHLTCLLCGISGCQDCGDESLRTD